MRCRLLATLAASATPARVFAVALVLRLLNTLLVRTYAAPDEHWQAPELAHKLVFGVGYVTWEWWPSTQLRSALHPLLLAAPLWVLRETGLDSWQAVAATPRVLHAVLAACTDASVFVLALRVFGSTTVAAAAVACHWLSWFVCFAGARPFANSLEATLVTSAYAAWASACARGDDGATWSPVAAAVAGALAGLAVSARPTAALLVFAIAACDVVLARGAAARARLLRRAAATALPAAAAALALGALADRALFGAWTLPAAAFLRFNSSGGDAAYGAYPAAWYLWAGLPAVAGTQLPLIVAGVWASRSSAAMLAPAAVAAVVVAALSAAPHKEHRFLLPIAPLLALYAGRGLVALDAWARGTGGGAECAGDGADAAASPTPSARGAGDKGGADGLRRRARGSGASAAPSSASAPVSADSRTRELPRWRRRAVGVTLAAVAATNAAVAVYINVVHQRGPIAVAEEIARLAHAAAARGVLVPERTDDFAARTRGDGRVDGALDDAESARLRAVLGGDVGEGDVTEDEEEAAGADAASTALPAPSLLPQSALMAVHFWMPCHSTPFFATVHAPIVMLQFDCAPPAATLAATLSPSAAASVATGSRARPRAVLEWPPLSESEAWRTAPAALLRALYGDAPEPPLACAYAPAPGAAFVAAALARALPGDGYVHLLPASSCCAASGGVTHPDDRTHAATAAGFLSVFGGAGAGAGDNGAASASPPPPPPPPAGGNGSAAAPHPVAAAAAAVAADYRTLPTHVVLFDADAERPAVAAFLTSHGYAPSRSFFFAHVATDAHAARQTREPSRVLLFEHACWGRLGVDT